MRKHLDLAQELRMDSCVILGTVIEYFSTTKYWGKNNICDFTRGSPTSYKIHGDIRLNPARGPTGRPAWHTAMRVQNGL